MSLPRHRSTKAVDGARNAPRRAPASSSATDPAAAAECVGLRYVSDQMSGIRREKSGKGFRFRNDSGRIVRDEATLKRIRSLAIPPAWTNVWICPNPDGHLQATGRDARGRKQFRYHPRWREVRDETKFARMLQFARALPKIRRRVRRDLARPGLPREKVLATVVRLLETSLIRVGNDEYARNNDSFGLTTLRDRHARVNGSRVHFQFRGKSGKLHEIGITDRRLARIVKSCQDLPGQELFQFVDAEGEVRDVGSADVNAYLREISGSDYTAKDFRTWGGTVLAATALRDLLASGKHPKPTKKCVVAAIQCVAQCLGNTPAVCRKCYVHPVVLESFLEGHVIGQLAREATLPKTETLNADEMSVLKLLENQLTLEQRLSRALNRSRPRSRRRKEAGL